ncbi:MAG: ATPase domain-containing protein [Candidatus Altiarchaeota archaeon]
MSDRLSTGVKELDEILNGGIPRGHCVLLAGSCGTGKTILCQQFLFAGADAGEGGTYLALTEPRDKVVRNIQNFKFFKQEHIDNNKVKVVDLVQDTRLRGIGLNNVEGLIAIIEEILKSNNSKRLVIDSITALCENLLEGEKIRNFIFELAFRLMYLNVTTILISEIPPQTFKYSIFGIEEFVADGVIRLSEFERKGDLIRSLQVIKMRGMAHSRNKHVMKILDEGTVLVPMFKADME